MEYESSETRLPTNLGQKSNGNGLSPDVKAKVEDLLKQGASVNSIAKEVKVSKHTVIGLRNSMQDSGQFNHNSWKKHTSEVFSQIVTRGSERLLNEIDDLPVGQLPVALVIITDKILTLQDAPSVVVEHRLRVSHEDINSMIKGEIIDVKPIEQKEIDKS